MSSEQSVGWFCFSYFVYFFFFFFFLNLQQLWQWHKLELNYTPKPKRISCDVCACVDNAINTWTDTDCLFIFSPISLTRFIGLTLNFDETGIVILFAALLSLSLSASSPFLSSCSSSFLFFTFPIYRIHWIIRQLNFPYITIFIFIPFGKIVMIRILTMHHVWRMAWKHIGLLSLAV